MSEVVALVAKLIVVIFMSLVGGGEAPDSGPADAQNQPSLFWSQ